MAALTQQQKDAIGKALDFLKQVLDCYDTVPAANKTVPDEKLQELQRIVDTLRDMNNNGLIDWQTHRISVTASADRNGIHLNPNFGGDYSNDYTFPDDYQLDDCEAGYFHSLWRLLEILIHELYHYEHHSGFLGSIVALVAVVSYATAGNLIEALSGAFGPRLKHKYAGHEHQAYAYTHHLLWWIDSIIFKICTWGDPDCIDCCDQHGQWLDGAIARQDPYTFC